MTLIDLASFGLLIVTVTSLAVYTVRAIHEHHRGDE